jgi:opacity protein-like surface antigen
MKIVGLSILLLLACPARAADAPKWKSVFIGGASFSGKTNYSVNVAGSPSQLSSDQMGAATVNFGGEFSFQPGVLGGSLLVTGTRYSYSDGSPSDGELGIFFMPRLATNLGAVELWGGVGLGIEVTNLSATSAVVSGITITINNNPMTAFAWSPRAGIDFAIGSRMFIGAEVDYVATSPTANWTAVSGGSTITGTEGSSRHWFSAALRIGSFF